MKAQTPSIPTRDAETAVVIYLSIELSKKNWLIGIHTYALGGQDRPAQGGGRRQRRPVGLDPPDHEKDRANHARAGEGSVML